MGEEPGHNYAALYHSNPVELPDGQRGLVCARPPHTSLLVRSATMAACSPAYAPGDKGDMAVEDRPHWRRHKGACPFYRENWIASDAGDADPSGETVLYEIYSTLCTV